VTNAPTTTTSDQPRAPFPHACPLSASKLPPQLRLLGLPPPPSLPPSSSGRACSRCAARCAQYASPTGARQLVHGTFMTKAAWRVRTGAGRTLLIKSDAMRKAELELTVVESIDGAGGLQTIKMKPWQKHVFDDVSMA
jgi:hypothetical protein